MANITISCEMHACTSTPMLSKQARHVSSCHNETACSPVSASEERLPVPVEATRVLVVADEDAEPHSASAVGFVELLRGDVLRNQQRLVDDKQR